MSLSCSCGDWDGEGWVYDIPSEFIKLDTSKRKRCSSCKDLIDIGSDVLRFRRFRYARDEIELDIHGDDGEIDLAPWFICESCGEIYLSLDDLGFCLDPSDDMRVNLKDYQSDYAHPAWQSFKDHTEIKDEN